MAAEEFRWKLIPTALILLCLFKYSCAISYENMPSLSGKTVKTPLCPKTSICSCLLGAITFVVSILFASCTTGPPPGDDTLIEAFQKNRSDYTELAHIFELNPDLREVSARTLRSKDSDRVGISKSNIIKYRQLCDRLGISLLIRWDLGTIWLVRYDHHPFPPGGTYKGYALLADPPSDAIHDLDSTYEKLKQGSITRSFTVYRRIHGNWYLFLEYED